MALRVRRPTPKGGIGRKGYNPRTPVPRFPYRNRRGRR